MFNCIPFSKLSLHLHSALYRIVQRTVLSNTSRFIHFCAFREALAVTNADTRTSTHIHLFRFQTTNVTHFITVPDDCKTKRSRRNRAVEEKSGRLADLAQLKQNHFKFSLSLGSIFSYYRTLETKYLCDGRQVVLHRPEQTKSLVCSENTKQTDAFSYVRLL